MDITPTTFPKARRLGLSRSVGTNKNPSSTPTRTLINPPHINETPINTNDVASKTKPKELPNSENTENHSLKSNANINLSFKSNVKNVNETPVSSKPNKVTYKLSLCKSTTEILTRKRMLSQQSKSLMQPKRLKLEVKLDEIQTEESSSVTRNANCDTKLAPDEGDKTSGENEPPSKESLQTKIDELKRKISAIEKSERRSSEHRRLKAKWHEAGLKTIEELSNILQQDKRAILANYNIDPILFDLNLSE